MRAHERALSDLSGYDITEDDDGLVATSKSGHITIRGKDEQALTAERAGLYADELEAFREAIQSPQVVY